MKQQQIAPYGSWESPITSDLILSDAVSLGQIVVDGSDIYWIESRPKEGGRYVIVHRASNGKITDLLPQPYNARTRVHEYGGGNFAVSEGTIYFTNFADQRLYRLTPGSEPTPITPANQRRYADMIVDRQHNRLICICEDHSNPDREAVNTIVSVSLADGAVQTLLSGNDFYSNPRLSPDGSRLAWLTWHHPNMPWDGDELWVAELDANGTIADPAAATLVAGGDSESLFQPEWSPSGVLHVVSDRTNWWNLYRWKNGQIEALVPKESEFGTPQWLFAMSTYGFTGPDRIVCIYSENGGTRLSILDTTSSTLNPIALPYTSIAPSLQVTASQAVLVAASPSVSPELIRVDLASGQYEVVRRSSSVKIDPTYISVPQSIEFPTEHGLTAYAYYYPPCNPDYIAPEGELPPLLVLSHGGPTSAVGSALNTSIQFWTSRGFAVVNVNYGGSSGYGRAYRQRLNGQWGIVDVDDCANAARYLVERGLADGRRLAIRGGSAGGYTTLCALSMRDVFAAGASHFGVSDLSIFVQDTHKFESRYLFSLVGPYPERADIYAERSALNHLDTFSCPTIFFQGLEDKVVPPSQAEIMVEALKKKGVPVAYLAYEGEQHGFRRAENIKRTLETELYFYSKIFHFDLPVPVEPVAIDNL